MIENNLIEFASRESNADPLTELLRQGARQLIAQAVEAELAVFICQHRCTAQTAVGTGVSRMVHPSSGSRPMGVSVG